MKNNSVFLNTCSTILLFVLSLINPTFAQKPSEIKLGSPKINYYLKPGINQINFPKKDSAKAAKVASYIHQFVSKKLDSVNQIKQERAYMMDSTQRVDFMLDLTLSKGRFTFGEGFPESSYLSLNFINKATKDTIPITATDLGEINEADEGKVQFTLAILIQHIFIHLEGLTVNSSKVVNPNNYRLYKKQGATIIPYYFTANTSQLEPVAKTVTHFVNNAFAELQTRKLRGAYPVKGKKPLLSYYYNYYPNYRLASQDAQAINSKDFLVTGKVYQKDKKHLALKVNFKGPNIRFKLHDSTVKKEIVFRKDLIEKGIYSELAYKIRQNFGLFVMCNY